MKEFLYKDKTGRGEQSTLLQKNLLMMSNEEDYHGEKLHIFAKYSEIGETWENRCSSFTRIK
jgi:hypothetical protein